MTSEHPYAGFIQGVQKPSQYLGGEHGEVAKDWSRVGATVCLAFPDLYEIGMSHLGFKILYSKLNADETIAAERAYAPWKDMEAELRARGEPLRSLETWHALSEFDVVGFSLQFELTYTNVLLMLDLGGIPLRAADRGDRDPLVLAGGPTATHAEPIAPFFDAILIGDGEVAAPAIVRTWAAMTRARVGREERLRAVAALPGVYVPSLYATRVDADTGFTVVDHALAPEASLPVARAFVPDLSAHPFPHDGPVAATETTFDRVSIEIARGCTEGCRFCQAGMIYRPVRERDPLEIVNTIERAVAEGGYDEASLTCLSTADYSAISPLVREVMQRMQEKKVSLSVSSLRAYGLSEELLDEIQKVRATGLTFAPEAGSQRMRDVVNKNVTEEQLMETAQRVFSRGWSKMKLYFMIGLPTEEDDDVRGIVQTGERARQVGRRAQNGGSPRVVVSVSTHVPKPHTPFQWCAMDARDDVLRKQSLLREEAQKTRVDLRMHDSGGSWLEGILARGDRTLAPVLEAAYRDGARFDSWEEELRLGVWQRAITASGIDVTKFLGTIPVDARLPWDHIDVGLEDGFLAREYRKSLQSRLSPPCGKVAGQFIHATNVEEHDGEPRRLVCYDCGVACDLTQMRTERREFLIGLDALVKPSSTPSVTRLQGKNGRKKPPPRNDLGEFQRVRLSFTKLGRAAFVSHLDLVRLLPRLLRRARLPLYYTGGFHPKPDMTFAPALSLGVSSLGELVDIKVKAGADLSDLDAALAGVASDGVRFLGARVLGPNDAAVSKLMDEADYVAALPRDALVQLGIAPGDVGALTALIAQRRATGELVVRRTIEGIGKNVDVGRYLLDVRVGEGGDVLAQAGFVGELLPVAFTVQLTGQGTAKASEVVEALLGDVTARIVRAGLYARRDGVRHHPLSLEALRRLPAHGPAEPSVTTVASES